MKEELRSRLSRRERFYLISVVNDLQENPCIQTILRYVEERNEKSHSLSLSLSLSPPEESLLFLKLYVSFGETRAADESGFIFFLFSLSLSLSLSPPPKRIFIERTSNFN